MKLARAEIFTKWDFIMLNMMKVDFRKLFSSLVVNPLANNPPSLLAKTNVVFDCMLKLEDVVYLSQTEFTHHWLLVVSTSMDLSSAYKKNCREI